MKLAEALQERADLNKKIEQLRSRITSNALMQASCLLLSYTLSYYGRIFLVL